MASIDIIGTVIGTGVTLAGLIVASHWRLSTRLTVVEKETARLSALLEGLGMSGRVPPRASAAKWKDSDSIGPANCGLSMGDRIDKLLLRIDTH